MSETFNCDRCGGEISAGDCGSFQAQYKPLDGTPDPVENWPELRLDLCDGCRQAVVDAVSEKQ